MLPKVKFPRYGRRDLNCAWYHQLHGHVPGAQQEKMLEPEPDEELHASPHINTAWRLLSMLAPRLDEGLGVSFANLSTQPEPGRGGLAVILAIRTLKGSGSVDHGGREGALIRHALIAVNRGLGQTTLACAAESLIRHSVGLANLQLGPLDERRDGPVDEWYHSYHQNKDWTTTERKQCLLQYLQSFCTLPEIQEPGIAYHYAGTKPAKQLVYVEHDPQLTYYDLIAYASYLASALHFSSVPDCPWAAVQFGIMLTEPDPGLTIRFIPENTLRDEPGLRIPFRSLPPPGARDSRQRLHELMAELFGLSVEPLSQCDQPPIAHPQSSRPETSPMDNLAAAELTAGDASGPATETARIPPLQSITATLPILRLWPCDLPDLDPPTPDCSAAVAGTASPVGAPFAPASPFPPVTPRVGKNFAIGVLAGAGLLLSILYTLYLIQLSAELDRCQWHLDNPQVSAPGRSGMLPAMDLGGTRQLAPGGGTNQAADPPTRAADKVAGISPSGGQTPPPPQPEDQSAGGHQTRNKSKKANPLPKNGPNESKPSPGSQPAPWVRPDTTARQPGNQVLEDTIKEIKDLGPMNPSDNK